MQTKIYVSIYPKKLVYGEGYKFKDSEIDFSNILSCPLCGTPVSGGRLVPPIRYRLNRAKTADFIYVYGGRPPFLISERVWNEIQKSDLTGIESVLPAEVYYKRTPTEQKYFYIEKFKRVPLAIDRTKSRIGYGDVSSSPKCPLCNPLGLISYFYLSLCFDMSTYDGTDIFSNYENGNIVFFSQRFIDFCAEHEFTNFHCIEASVYDEENVRAVFDDEYIEKLLNKFKPYS